MDTYYKLLTLVEPKYKIKVNFNKRVDDLHNKLDLVYIDGVYKDKDNESNKGDKKYGGKDKCDLYNFMGSTLVVL